MKKGIKKIRRHDIGIIHKIPFHAPGKDMVYKFLKAKKFALRSRISTEIFKNLKNNWSIPNLISEIQEIKIKNVKKQKEIKEFMKYKESQKCISQRYKS
mmetsp:Transcript_8537/g.7559  ORF Transcript_8537/g.7559 Transcript_8537/m.7559 type:complete len:99 (+) Transcript_8537:503-799(+)